MLEAVFVTLLGPAMPDNEILTAMLTYRALYYLGPLVLAVAVYTMMELRRRKGAAAAAGTSG